MTLARMTELGSKSEYQANTLVTFVLDD